MNSFSFLFSSVSLSVSVAHYQILRVTSMNFFLTFHLYHYQWLHLILDHCDSQTTVILSPSVDCGECESWLYLQTCTVFLFLSVHTCLTLMTVSVSGSGYGHGESWAVAPPPPRWQRKTQRKRPGANEGGGNSTDPHIIYKCTTHTHTHRGEGGGGGMEAADTETDSDRPTHSGEMENRYRGHREASDRPRFHTQTHPQRWGQGSNHWHL